MSNSNKIKSIALLGTGLMGRPMAVRILNAGYSLSVWNRTVAKVRPLLDLGAKGAATPSEAAAGADLLITMLADGPTVSHVLFDNGVADALSPGSIVVDMSSIPPSMARDHAERLAKTKILHLDAPVSGGTKGAAEGTLAIMVGGTAEAFEISMPALRSMGRPTLVGKSGSGQLAKLANQTIVAITIGAVSEALLLASTGGADPQKVSEALSGGFSDSLILKLHGQRMLDRDFMPGGPTRMQVKDLRTILETAKNSGLELPVTETITAMYEDLLESGYGECDHSAVLLELERRNVGKRLGIKPDQIPSD